MLGAKDPAIKLFGKTIPLTSSSEDELKGKAKVVDGGTVGEADSSSSLLDVPDEASDDERREDKVHPGKQPIVSIVKEGSEPPPLEELVKPTSFENNGGPNTPSAEREVGSAQASRDEEDQSETCSSQDKGTLKKPDKIIPCPRCDSMDTKFCYYNNYNVNQPRHFCKKCQRYWTNGGTMRNVPVGAGRRKNKNSIPHYRHITVSEALQTVRNDAPNGMPQPTLQPNGNILTFGSDAPLRESMSSALNLADKTMWTCTQNGSNNPEEQRLPLSCGGQGGDENSNRSSVTASSSTGEGKRVGMQEPIMQNMHGFPPQIPGFSGVPWTYPWNSAQWNTPLPPSIGPPSFPVSFVPAPTYWGCPIPGTWSMPWPSPPPISPSSGVSSCAPTSPTLGKHSREGDAIQGNEDPPKRTNSNGGVLIPKTLRIDDPGEAAKSSIWDTLGIKKDGCDSSNGGRLVKAFRSKGDEKNQQGDEKNQQGDEASQALHANPAALSRSLNFRESS